MNPIHRVKGLVVQEHDGEMLVYDLEKHRAISLNKIVTIVWHASDGKRDVDSIVEYVSAETGMPVPKESVLLALDELRKEDLLDASSAEGYLGGMTRREALRRIGLASTAALPIVLAITAPLAVHAQSTCIPGGTCTCNQNSSGRQGLQCTPAVPCANLACRCVWANNGNNPNGNCVV